MLHLQRARQTLLSLQFLAFDLFLAAHLDFRHGGHGIELDAVQHGGEQLEGLALVFLLRVFLRVAAQENALAHVIHGGQVLAPMLIEGTEHDLLLDVTHDLRSDVGFLLGVRPLERGHDFLLQTGAVTGFLFLDPSFDG